MLIISETQLPVVTQPNKKTELEVNPYQPIRISCQASAVPPPQITWFKVMYYNYDCKLLCM